MNNVNTNDIFKASLNPDLVLLPVLDIKVSAGQSRFPSPAQDYEATGLYENVVLDLNQKYVTNPPATFLMPVMGDSMSGIGIYPGSMLIIDRSITVKSSSIVVVHLDGERLVKRLYKRGGIVRLLSENPAHKPIEITEDSDLTIVGVVTYVINPAQ